MARYVDRLAGLAHVNRHPAIRAQLRRATLDALASASNALDEDGVNRSRRESLRCLGALYELEVLVRIGLHAGALTHAEQASMTCMHRRIASLIRDYLAAGGHAFC